MNRLGKDFGSKHSEKFDKNTKHWVLAVLFPVMGVDLNLGTIETSLEIRIKEEFII